MFLPNPYHDLFVLLQDQSEELRLAARKKLIWAYSWAVPNEEAIRALVAIGPIVELGAGTGYWSWLLRVAGADVIALDHEALQPPCWSEVLHGDETSVNGYGARSLLLCWPPYQSPMAYRALQTVSQGTRIAYIGEMDGRTADSSFHAALREECQLKAEIVIPNWPGYRDRMFVFTKL